MRKGASLLGISRFEGAVGVDKKTWWGGWAVYVPPFDDKTVEGWAPVPFLPAPLYLGLST